MTSASLPNRWRNILPLVGLILVGASLRAPGNIIGPVFYAVADDLDLQVFALSVLGAAPPIGFAIAGLLVPSVTRRIRIESAVLLALLVVVLAQVIRAFCADPVLLVGSTFAIMIGIGGLNVLLPPLVGRYFPQRIGFMTSLYLVVMSVTGTTPPFVGVAITEASNWRVALVVWSVFPILALGPWIALMRSSRRAAPAQTVASDAGTGASTIRSRVRVSRSPTTWALTALIALSAISGYILATFIPGILVDTAGLTPGAAGFVLGISFLLTIPAMIVVPLLAVRPRLVMPVIATVSCAIAAGWLGLLIAPAAAPVAWSVLVGFSPAVFPLALVLINTRTRDQVITVGVSAFAQGGGYVAAAAFSLAFGIVQQATGSWSVSIIVVLIATGILSAPAMVVLAQRGLIDDEIRSRTRARRAPHRNGRPGSVRTPRSD